MVWWWATAGGAPASAGPRRRALPRRRRCCAALVDLASGSPDAELLPPLATALRDIDARPRLFAEPAIDRQFGALAGSELAADGVPAQALVVVSGTLDAIDRLLREHLRPGDRVAVEDPVLPALLELLAVSGLQPEPFAGDAAGPEPDSWERAMRRARAVVLTSRAQNPTGSALSRARATELKRRLRKHRDRLVIELDPAGPVAGVALETLCDGAHPRWAFVRSTSKFLGPDLRVALVAGDPLTIARVQGRQTLGPRRVSHLLQQVAFRLWSDPSSGRRLARAADVYAQRRTALLAAMAAHGLTAAAPSGFNIWLPVRNESSTVQALAERGWAVAAGERFRVRSAPGIRVTTSALAVEEAPRLAADLLACVDPPQPAWA